ncbi:MAG TPA: hydantoinase/oxoprolinase family protein [Spirochaetota bacterium]|nr:hydantoinase/oxoprolinase family protein [Spirochaetota bacterium]
MFCGIDVGGTHTDAVLADENGIVATSKIVTDRNNLVGTIRESLDRILGQVNPGVVEWINISTTLSTNAIVEDKTEKVGVLVSSGPGVNPSGYEIGDNFRIIRGSIDHRGTVVQELDAKDMKGALKEFSKKGLKVFSVISKFSTRNPSHEGRLAELVQEAGDYITQGHRLSGELNFPRRITTAYYNSAVWRLYNQFADAVEKSIAEHGVSAAINILKADGGTMPLELSRMIPVETILSGPAASVMGIIALCHITEDSIILDIGGTTTDIAVFAEGAPLIEREGISINHRPTLVRALKTHSIGIGGDSLLSVTESGVQAGPERKGPAMAQGGDDATLIDAFNYSENAGVGDQAASVTGIRKLAEENGMDPGELARQAIQRAVNTITAEVNEVLEEINKRPVYTIHELLEDKHVEPKKLYIMGGPAEAFAEVLGKAFNLPVVIPAEFAVANAVGAALARTTRDIELLADTEKGQLIIPSLDVMKPVDEWFTLADAESEAQRYLLDYLKKMNADKGVVPEIVEASSFNMVDGFTTVGKNIRVKCQVKPGVLFTFGEKPEARNSGSGA